MRYVGTVESHELEENFSAFLNEKKIIHQVDEAKNNDWGSPQYGITTYTFWVEEEDQAEEVIQWLDLFKTNPNDPLFNVTKAPPSFSIQPEKHTGWNHQPMGWMTKSLIVICCMLLTISQMWTVLHPAPKGYANLSVYESPINQTLLYDYPLFYQFLNKFITIYGYEDLANPKELPPEGAALYQKINRTPTWTGILPLLIEGDLSNVSKGFKEKPLFEKISQGEIWRLFTPCLLHGDILHLFFNMLWLAVLGKQIEQRLKIKHYLLMIVLVGIFSNTCQYLMSGPTFLGFSGILCGMLAFIWVRQKKAAWEGYPIDRMTLLFMLIFVLGMASLEVFAFFIEKFYNYSLPLTLANTAHLTGGLAGWGLAQLDLFSWKEA